MMRSLHTILLTGFSLGSLFLLSGCYTQVGTTRDADQEEYSAVESDTTGDDYEQSYTDNYYDGANGMPAYRYGFDYYYPTFGFGFSAYDPWYYRHSGWYYYDPFICGTYYPSIYAGWYPYWYPHGIYYYPGYGHKPFAFGGRRSHGTTRTFGTTRGGGVVRGGSRDDGGYRGASSGATELPTGYRSGSGSHGNPPPASTPRVSTGRTSSDGGRAVTRGGSRGRAGNTRGGSGKSREGVRQGPPRTYTPAPQSTPPSQGRGADRGGSSRSYSPPRSSPPAQSTPPSGGGNSSGSSGGSRGGRNR
ncbi:MAG: hypothetical protein HW407_385 [Bacteroidetes bacterium]|nr:hypothetical protein [Bacteroidota bacterium]